MKCSEPSYSWSGFCCLVDFINRDWLSQIYFTKSISVQVSGVAQRCGNLLSQSLGSEPKKKI